jgi:hypothetical protein
MTPTARLSACMTHRPVIRCLGAFSACLLSATTVAAQSLYLDRGQRGLEGMVGWSVGPSSDGVETSVGVALDGRVDVGFAFNRYELEFDDGTSLTFKEYAPFVRYFAIKEEKDGPPVSLALHGQFFGDDYTDEDTGWYVMTGTTIYKRLRLSKDDTNARAVSLYPFLGFSFVGESYSDDGGRSERAVYLTRNLGMHVAIPLDAAGATLLRATVEEQSFRRETYRAVRIGIVRRF